MDEDSMGRGLARGLRQNGIDVVTVAEVGREALHDEDQLAFAASVGRVIYSSNVGDFARIHHSWMRAGRRHTGIVVLENQNTPVGVQIRALTRIAETIEPEAIGIRMEYLANWVS